MAVEAAVAIWSGVRANSLSLLAFGIDSVIELASASVLMWRLTVELRRGEAFAESAERIAGRIAGGLLVALAAYVAIAAAWKLRTGTGQAFSLSGLIVALLAIPVMSLLARRKLKLAAALGSSAMRADAMESVACLYLSAAVVIGLAVQALVGVSWADSAASFGIVFFLLKEGREAWRGSECC